MSLFGRVFHLNLRMKFILPVTVILVTTMVIFSTYLIRRQSEGFRHELESSGETMVKMLALNAESGVLFGSRQELADLLKTPAQFKAVKHVIIRNEEGEMLAQVGDLPWLCNSKPEIDESDGDKDSTCLKYLKAPDNNEYLVVCKSIITLKPIVSRENLGMTGGLGEGAEGQYAAQVIGHVELALSLDAMNHSISEAKLAAYLVTAILLLGTILLMAFIAGAITKPVRELVTITDQVSKGDLNRHVGISQKDEIGHLAKTFNRMIDSLKQSRDEIEQYNRNLEQKIIERTLQLEEAQAQLIQSEKMSAIGQLAAGVAHELNNPLGGILGYAQFTLEKLQKNVPEKTSTKEIQSYIRYVSDIEAQARRCKTIVQNLLRFSRSSRTMDFEEVDVNKTIEETLTFVGHQLHLNQVDLQTQLDQNLPHITGNAGQLQQVFTNLIINAMHASQPGSALKITSRFSPALGEFGGAVELQFIDHGHGIKEENLKKIFEPFFTTKEVGKGTGLGLSVSYGIIKEHGGEITVQSKVGEGSTFTVVLPVQKPDTDADTRQEATFSFGG